MSDDAAISPLSHSMANVHLHHTSFQDVLDTVGVQICYFLHPKELCSFGMCNKHLWDAVVQSNLAMICAHHMPLYLGVGTNYLAEFHDRHSFSNKEELLEYVLDMTERANIFIDDTKTFDKSRSRATETLLNQDSRSAKFYSHDNSQTTTVECHYQNRSEKLSAISWTHYIMDRDAHKRTNNERAANKFIRGWLNFISTQRHIELGLWRWTCKHPSLFNKGIAGVGVILAITDENERRNEMELRLTRKY